MKRQALFCDGTINFVLPPEPDKNQKILFTFRTGKDDVNSVEFLTGGRAYQMEKKRSQGDFDFYELEWFVGDELLNYSFFIRSVGESCYYNRMGPVDELQQDYCFIIVPGFSTPDWAKGAVMYQIFTDRFCNGDKENDVVDNEYFYIDGLSVKQEDWNSPPQHGALGVREFYGGDLQGVMDKFDYLQDLGVEVIYFNPLFVSPSNHKYDIQDYGYIDPHLGKIVSEGGSAMEPGAWDNKDATRYQHRTTKMENLEASNQLFVKLVEEAHARGIRVILDGVFNHCGSFNKWMDKERIYENQEGYQPGAFVSKDSPYRDFFKFYRDNWPYNIYYDGWWSHDTLPKLNYEDSLHLEEYILEIARKWVSPPYNADGWRLDVAADLGFSAEYNHQFFKAFRKTVKEANPNAIILAEHYGNPREWLMGDEWDSVMNYDAFMEPITWFLTGLEKHSDEYREDLLGNQDFFINCINHHMSTMLTPSLQVAMNELSNHDHSRFLTRTNQTVGRVEILGSDAASTNIRKEIFREAVIFQMTWIGAPTIYYGDETSVTGFTDPDNRRTIPWNSLDDEMIQFHKEVISIHKKYQAFKTGSLKMLFADFHVLAFGRFCRDQHFIIILNNRETVVEVHVPAWEIEVPKNSIMRRLIYSYIEGYTMEHEEYVVDEAGEVVVNMGPRSAIILKQRNF